MKFTLFSILALLPFTAFAGIQVVSQSPNSLSLDIQLENVSEMPDTVGTHDYLLYRFDDGIMEEQTGKPALPYLLYSLAVPPKARITYRVSVLQSDAREGVDVVPQNRVYIRGGIKEMPRDEEIYSGSIPYPEETVRLGEPQNFRGANVAQLRINPIQYFPAAHRVLINKHLRIDFKFEGTAALAAAPAGRPIRDKVLSQKLVNYQQAQGFASPVKVSFAKAAANYDFSSGQWFRFPVKEDGVYQITGSFLKSKGVDIGEIQLSGVHLYNYGGYLLSYNVNEARPGDLNEIAVQVVDDNQNGVMDESDRIIFYGKGLGGWKYDANSHKWDYGNFPYDDANYYLFTFDSQPGKRIQSMDSPNLQNPRVPAEFMDYLHFESDRYNILSSGLDWYWIRMSGMQDKKSLTFSLPQNLANDTLRMYFHFKGGSGSDYGDDANYVYRIKTILNQQVLFDNLTFSRAGHGYREIRYNNLQSAKGGDNDLELYLTGNLDGCEAYLDYFNVQVDRPFVAENKALHFRDVIAPETPVEYHLSGFPGGTNTVWDISDLSNVKNIQPLQNGQSIRFQDTAADWKGADYFVFSPDVIRNVDAMEAVENHANLRDPSRRAEFIIITPDEFYDQAEFLENRRESQVPNPIETERVRLSDIFDEFSSSVRDITAIRDFLKYAYENWSDSLQYVLLFGDGHYDYRNILLKDMPDYIPPFEISNDYEIDSREADNYYVAFGNTGNLSNLTPWLPLARLPFNNPEQIAVYREKADHYAKSFLLNPDKNGWQTWVTLVADDQYGGGGTSSEWYHLQPTELVNKKYIPEKFNRAKIYLHDYDRVAGGLGRLKPKATEDLINQLNRGTLLINYFGHGDPDTWAHEYLLVRSRDLPRIHNEDRLPLWVAATCTWGKFDDPNHNSMSEELLWLPQRGGIGVVSAGRPVYVNSNTALAESLYNNLFHGKSDAQPSMRLGDA
ncbi:MAG: C25 family cysteine peptidase, partial [Calditrichia bacterium]